VKFFTDHCTQILLVGAPTLVWLFGLVAKNLIVKFNVALLGADILYCALSICIAAVIRSTAVKGQGQSSSIAPYLVLGLVTAIFWITCLRFAKSAIKAGDERDEILGKSVCTAQEQKTAAKLGNAFVALCTLSVFFACVVYFMDIIFALATL